MFNLSLPMQTARSRWMALVVAARRQSQPLAPSLPPTTTNITNRSSKIPPKSSHLPMTWTDTRPFWRPRRRPLSTPVLPRTSSPQRPPPANRRLSEWPPHQRPLQCRTAARAIAPQRTLPCTSRPPRLRVVSHSMSDDRITTKVMVGTFSCTRPPFWTRCCLRASSWCQKAAPPGKSATLKSSLTMKVKSTLALTARRAARPSCWRTKAVRSTKRRRKCTARWLL